MHGFDCCNLLDGVGQLEDAQSQLPGLEHLVVRNVECNNAYFRFPTGALRQLLQFTHLVIVNPSMYSHTEAKTALQPLQALTRLAHLKVGMQDRRCSMTASIMSGMNDLTHLVIIVLWSRPPCPARPGCSTWGCRAGRTR
jgi:hypothetical protein